MISLYHFIPLLLLFRILARADTEMLLEYFPEVFRIAETSHFCNFSYAVFLLFQ